MSTDLGGSVSLNIGAIRVADVRRRHPMIVFTETALEVDGLEKLRLDGPPRKVVIAMEAAGPGQAMSISSQRRVRTLASRAGP